MATSAAFKALKALKSVSSTIFTKLRSLIDDGWKTIWDDGLKKLLIKNDVGDDVAEIASRTENIVDSLDPTPNFPNNQKEIASTTIKAADGWALKQADAIDNAANTTPTGADNRYIGKKNIAKNAQRIKVEQQGALKSKIDEFFNSGTPPDPLGTLTEEADVLLKRQMYPSPDQVYDDIHYNRSGNGFDSAVELTDGTIIIGEAKQMGSGSFTLGETNNASQMSDQWITDVVDKMKLNGGDQLILANKIELAQMTGKLQKTVTGIDRSTREVVIVKLGQF